MPIVAVRIAAAALCLLLAACGGRSLPPYERPLARTQFQTVRTTAYTHTEADHTQYANRNACGDCLRSGSLNSASCDWSRWPVGTTFRLQETGENYLVDDYGWALAGTNTIDLYKPTRSAMNAWGVRRVHLEITHWGDVQRSLAILQPRAKHAHVRRMLTEMRQRYAELARPMPLIAANLGGGTELPGPKIVGNVPPRAEPMAANTVANGLYGRDSGMAARSGYAPAPGAVGTQSRPLLTPFSASEPR